MRIEKLGNVVWFTNLETDIKRPPLKLTEKYDPIKYPTYDNYNAINVDKVKDIPKDYYDVMGVPITFLGKHNKEQFEIIDINPHFFMWDKQKEGEEKPKQLTLKNVGRKDPYARILIKRKGRLLCE